MSKLGKSEQVESYANLSDVLLRTPTTIATF